jgi:hypothetical protein
MNFPVSGKVCSKVSVPVGLAANRKWDRIKEFVARQLRIRQVGKPIHARMGSIVLDDADFREHAAKLGVLHIERDNRLPNACRKTLLGSFAAGIR